MSRKQTIALRVEPEVREALMEAAIENGVTMSTYAHAALREKLRHWLPDPGPMEPSAHARLLGNDSPLGIINRMAEEDDRGERITLLQALALASASEFGETLREPLAGLAEGMAAGDEDTINQARQLITDAMFAPGACA